MSSGSIFEDGEKLLTPRAFDFVLDSELKRAVRSQAFLTLVVVEASREWQGMTMTADDGTVQEIAHIVGREVRDTDLLGHTKEGILALVLLDVNSEHSNVVDRLVSRLEDHEFSRRIRIAVGAACYPTHAVDAAALKRKAMSHPIATWRARPSDDETPHS